MAISLGAGAGVWIVGVFWSLALFVCCLTSKVRGNALKFLIVLLFILVFLPLGLVLLALYENSYTYSGPVIYEYITHIRRALLALSFILLLVGFLTIFNIYIIKPIHAEALKSD